MRIRLVLWTALLLIALAVAATLARAPQTVAATNGVPLALTLTGTTSDTRVCQARERLPQDTSTVRLGLFALLGPKITLQIFTGPRLITEGTRAAGWDATEVAVAVKKTTRSISPATLCFGLTDVNSEVSLIGNRVAPALAMTERGKPLPGRISVEYAQPGRTSWWSSAGTAVRDLGFEHALVGIWSVLLIAALTMAIVVLSSWLILRDLQGRSE
ncbi:MAG TPA: hypothetical protein VGL57_00885 [Solirubrobacteraceae bacterium]